MTFKALISELYSTMSKERSRLPNLYYADAKVRTKGRIQGIKRAIQIAKRMQKERMGV